MVKGLSVDFAAIGRRPNALFYGCRNHTKP